MQNVAKIVGINLLILLIYMVLINVTSTGHERALGVLVLAAFAIGAHVFINILISFTMFFKKHKDAKAFLLSAGVVLVIGFSSCLGSASL